MSQPLSWALHYPSKTVVVDFMLHVLSLRVRSLTYYQCDNLSYFGYTNIYLVTVTLFKRMETIFLGSEQSLLAPAFQSETLNPCLYSYSSRDTCYNHGTLSQHAMPGIHSAPGKAIGCLAG